MRAVGVGVTLVRRLIRAKFAAIGLLSPPLKREFAHRTPSHRKRDRSRQDLDFCLHHRNPLIGRIYRQKSFCQGFSKTLNIPYGGAIHKS
jgi:hypothetical protein